jgi:hypothetical protein
MTKREAPTFNIQRSSKHQKCRDVGGVYWSIGRLECRRGKCASKCPLCGQTKSQRDIVHLFMAGVTAAIPLGGEKGNSAA